MEVWLISSGIEPDMGGIASVTRSCLAALTGNPESRSDDPAQPCPRVSRLICLRRPETAPDGLLQSLDSRNCGGKRRKCLVEVARQMVERPDLLLYEHVDLGQCQTMLPRALRRPYAVWGHGIELWRSLPPRKERTLREADALLFNSAFTRKKAGSFHPWILDRPWRIVPLCREGNGPESAIPGESPPPARKPWILTVGRLHDDRPKGHREILAALPALLHRVPDLHWHIAGSGPWRKTLETMIDASPARDHITLHGFLDRTALDRLYRQSRVFAMPSRGEGFGLVYAEAMAHGVPCVASTLDAAPEVLGSTGACVDPENIDHLGNVLAELLLAPPETFQRLSDAAAERATFFELKRSSADLKAALSQLRRG